MTFPSHMGRFALLSPGEGKEVSFHTSLPEDRCVRLLLKNVGNRNQDPDKDCPLTPHFTVSVARGPSLAKVRSLTELCGLRVKVETYTAPKGPLQCKRCQSFGHTHPSTWLSETRTRQGRVRFQSSSLNAAAGGQPHCQLSRLH
jgi:hypothetical protein